MRTKRAQRSIMLHFLRGGAALICAGAVFYGIWSITRLPFFTIRTVEVIGGPTVSKEEVTAAVEHELEGSYMFLVPRRFTYAYPRKSVLENVLAIPRIASAEVIRTDRNTVQVRFDEYAPHALWCAQSESRDEHVSAQSDERNSSYGLQQDEEDGRATQHENSQPCLFLSATGYAFAEAPSLTGTAFIRYMTEARMPAVHTQIFDAERMRNMELFMEGLKTEFALRVYAVTLTRDEDIIYHLKDESEILMTESMSLQDALNNLHSVLEAEEFKDLKPGAFDYIDLRFGNRVFVKEEFTPAATEAASPEELQEGTE